ncbi:hypothetical protein FKM82_031250, partial [Ascaphus truei]
GFVTKLDRFIRWLQEAMEATENWTPPQPETEALQLYLQTHLNFKQSVDGHCGLKDAVLQEGERLMELLVSHRPGNGAREGAPGTIRLAPSSLGSSGHRLESAPLGFNDTEIRHQDMRAWRHEAQTGIQSLAPEGWLVVWHWD